MAHFAEIKDGKVARVIVCDNIEWAIKTLGGEWVQTSYNTRGGIHFEPNSNNPSKDQNKMLRKNYAGIGYTYDKERDVFIPPKPYNSWVLDEETCQYKAPIEMPKDDKLYSWNEDKLEWEEVIESETKE
jgi:hypothetical protein